MVVYEFVCVCVCVPKTKRGHIVIDSHCVCIFFLYLILCKRCKYLHPFTDYIGSKGWEGDFISFWTSWSLQSSMVGTTPNLVVSQNHDTAFIVRLVIAIHATSGT